ncbi:predicted protein [Streptomyces sp. AA4]|nr:predicted protein [Streptomyces sp. AA4]
MAAATGSARSPVLAAEPPATPSPADPAPHPPTTSSPGNSTSHPPTTTSTADTDPAQTPVAPDRDGMEPTPGHPYRLPALLLALTVLLATVGVWCTVEARSTSASAAASNHALTDQPATAEVTSALSLTLNKIFSYTYDKTDVTENAAATLLRGHARDSYEKLFAQVRTMAPSQRLTLTSRVSATAVQQLTTDHAQLLVFLDQSATRGNSATPETAAAQLAVTAERIDGKWFVTDLAPR